jgi:DNA integrity scanning protein DisA with diadenylate cyclase activity
MAPPDAILAELMRAAVALVKRPALDQLVYISDLPPPTVLTRGAIGKKLIHVASSAARRDELLERGARALLLPGYEMGRQDKFKLALIGAFARGYVAEGEAIVGLVGRQPRAYPDTIHIARIEKAIVDVTPFGEIGGGQLPAAVFDAIVELAVQLGVEGWEGHALGTLFVVGDSPRVMESSRQLALNPFQGYSEEERNLADPAVRDALRSFATLDGGFIVREDGVVLAAGRYLQFPPSEVKVPLGLGARHMAAALATAHTNATAIVVSQSTGKVRVFRRGRVVLELAPHHRRT